MYELVSEAESKKYRNVCSSVLTETCRLLKEDYDVSAQFFLVGSGARNLITRNGNGPYDLDYNINIIKAPKELWNDLSKLKNAVRLSLNKTNGFDFSDAQDSTSVLTCLLYFKNEPQVEFSFDVAIVTEDNNGSYLRLTHNKMYYGFNGGQYTWNEVPKSYNVSKKAAQIKKAHQWELVRERYVEKKNMYLRRWDANHPSFVVYIEAVNEIYNKILRENFLYSENRRNL